MSIIDPRGSLAAQIEEYRSSYPEEASLATRFLDFMATHDECFLRSCQVGHITGSAFIVDPSRTRILLVHHAKLDKWLQPGGHCEPGETASQAALREAWEETGVHGSLALGGRLFDLDAHTIPARGDTPEHTHWDARYLIVVVEGAVVLSDESHAVEWMNLDEALKRNPETSLQRPLGRLRGQPALLVFH